MNVLSLFAGIGGLELGLERAGMTTVGQVELDPWCRQVLARHWPDVPQHDDVRTAPDWWASTERPHVDVVCGGFPCQPFSTAGAQLGIADERWGWPWFEGVIRTLRPRYVVVENVAALLRDRTAFGIVLADLAALGYDAEWDCIPAASVGAPHLRDRVFIVAYPRGIGRGEGPGQLGRLGSAQRGPSTTVADTLRVGRERGPRVFGQGRRGQPADSGRWLTEPAVDRVAHGVPERVDRIRSLGNAVVPAVSEHIGRLIVAAEARAGHAQTDGGCLVCDECDGNEGHDGPHDCGHEGATT